jgi:hypothetical protein
MFSKPVKGTHPNKLKMNWWEYWIGHCWMTGWQTIRMSFRNWKDLMTGNYEGYAVMFYDNPYEECYNTFWDYLGDDDVLPKDFLEGLMQMVDDIDKGKTKTYSWEEVKERSLNWADGILDGVDLNEELEDDDEV